MAVLIITCPCALALAVPIVQVVAAGRLFERGILMKDGAALERAAEVDTVAFDKTGTMTAGRPQVVDAKSETAEAAEVAAALAGASTHPLSVALVAHLGGAGSFAGKVKEVSGRGVEGIADGVTWRLGSREWCGLAPDRGSAVHRNLAHRRRRRPGPLPVQRHGAAERPGEACASLPQMDLPSRLLSGDMPGPVAAVAAAVGIGTASGALRPEQKVAAVSEGLTMMVGDGINDAPALRAAHVSMAPTSAADIGRSAADFVFSGEDLGAVPFVIGTARRAARLVNQNLCLAIGYNVIAVPLAICGFVTPLVAAIAMSSSSVIVVANALRLRFDRAGVPRREPAGELVEQSA